MKSKRRKLKRREKELYWWSFHFINITCFTSFSLYLFDFQLNCNFSSTVSLSLRLPRIRCLLWRRLSIAGDKNVVAIKLPSKERRNMNKTKNTPRPVARRKKVKKAAARNAFCFHVFGRERSKQSPVSAFQVQRLSLAYGFHWSAR